MINLNYSESFQNTGNNMYDFDELYSENNEHFTNIEHFIKPKINLPKSLPESSFLKEYPEGTIFRFKTHHNNKYLMAHSNGSVGQGGRGDWEKFMVKDVGNGKVGFWSVIHKKFLSANNNGKMNLTKQLEFNKLPNEWEWEKFTLYNRNGGWYIKTHHNTAIIAKDDGKVEHVKLDEGVENAKDWRTWEKFTIDLVEEVKKEEVEKEEVEKEEVEKETQTEVQNIKSDMPELIDNYCLIIDKPVDKKICFPVPNPKKLTDTTIEPIKKTITDMPDKIKKDVVDPAIKKVKTGLEKFTRDLIKVVENTINKIKKELQDLINKVKDEIEKALDVVKKQLEKVGEVMLNTITKILSFVIKALMVIFKPLFKIGLKLAQILWGTILKIAPFVEYVPFMMIASIVTPLFIPFIVIAFVLSIFTGPMILVVAGTGMLATPVMLYMFLKNQIIDLINHDWEKTFKNLGKKVPAMMKDVIELIEKTIKNAVDSIGKIKL